MQQYVVIARSLHQAPSLYFLDLSENPLGEGVSVITQHLSRVPRLEMLLLVNVKMTRQQVNDLSAAVRQSNISFLNTDYHVSFVILVCLCSHYSCLFCSSYCDVVLRNFTPLVRGASAIFRLLLQNKSNVYLMKSHHQSVQISFILVICNYVEFLHATCVNITVCSYIFISLFTSLSLSCLH